jgi:hypothetical protein
MSETPAPVKVLSSTHMAAALGINRSTLVRLEQRLIIPLAPLAPANSPIQGRLYDAGLAKQVRAAFAKYQQKSLADRTNRPAPPEAFVMVDRL